MSHNSSYKVIIKLVEFHTVSQRKKKQSYTKNLLRPYIWCSRFFFFHGDLVANKLRRVWLCVAVVDSLKDSSVISLAAIEETTDLIQ